MPAYAAVSVTGAQTFTWSHVPTGAVPVQRVSAGTDRIASVWYSPTAFDVNLNLTDGQTHQVGLYVIDYDAFGRSVRVDAVDAGTGQQLATASVTDMRAGRYLMFNVKGNVTFRVTNTGPVNGVLSGLFLDPVGTVPPPTTVPPPPPPPTTVPPVPPPPPGRGRPSIWSAPRPTSGSRR
jgi:hypothetical protein